MKCTPRLTLVALVLFCSISFVVSSSLFKGSKAPKLEKRTLRSGSGSAHGNLDSLPVLRADQEKADAVKEGMQHAWDNYVKYAWGMDELNPIAMRGSNGFGGMGCTIVDSLSTLKIMGMDSEFNKGRDWVRDNLHPERLEWVSLFETNIRHLGGLLSAYGLSGDKVFLEKAEEFGKRFLPAFHPESGLATNDINLRSGAVRARSSVSLAEVGTLQIEMLYLAYITKNPKYGKPVLQALRTLDGVHTDINNGLGSQTVDRATGSYRHDRWTLGAMADSYYEYLIKLHVFTGSNSDTGFRRMWDEAAVKIREHSLRTSVDTVYVGEIHSGRTNSVMDHLACFTGGMFALAGASEGGDKHDIVIGEGLTKTCVKAYTSMATGIAPEVFEIESSGKIKARNNHYLLRPETVESLYVLYRITGDPIYREMGWTIFQAFEKHCRVANGYSGISNVMKVGSGHDSKQQSFFMAETLKYLFLLFSASDVIPLDKYVFNTEAHPVPIPDKAGWSFLECHFPSVPRSVENNCHRQMDMGADDEVEEASTSLKSRRSRERLESDQERAKYREIDEEYKTQLAKLKSRGERDQKFRKSEDLDVTASWKRGSLLSSNAVDSFGDKYKSGR